ncbi:Na+/H+ antiporter NhaA [Mucilaginibacter antarcticus]|uniref:Na(+)/H(+) antiporter NhaA n=1 Tax=Mucilaginibacter antarcticus TaxID=1855725 RepID=A0ABW5XJ42_9SPHI
MKKTPIEKILAPVSRFIHLEYTSGVVLLACVLAAILWANLDHESYEHLWEINLSVGFDRYILSKPLHVWINDGLMAIFFFVIGLELKREFLAGELSTLKKASLPMMAALGGMIVPALLYVLINSNTQATRGWGIPMATDIAFALGLLSMAGKNVPPSIKIFLAALAVADDLGAVLVIAFFYTNQLNLAVLGLAAIFLVALIIGNKMGIRTSSFYLIVGIAVWICFYFSGIHATIAGVLVAFTVPAVTRISESKYSDTLRQMSYKFDEEIPNNSTLLTANQYHIIYDVKELSLAAETPLQKIEHAIHPWVAFIIMPLFAVANAGIIISADFFTAIQNPVTIGVMIGLVVGKFVGVISFTWLMIKSKISDLPLNASWMHIIGIALLAGVGFTMSLFISGLAFSNSLYISQAKYGILLASIIAGVLGMLVLKRAK